MYKIELNQAERAELERCVRRSKANARNIKRAHILLKSGDGWTLEQLVDY